MATVVVVLALAGLAAAQPTESPYRLDNAAVESGGGIVGSAEYTMDASAGRTGAGETQSETFAVRPPDAAPNEGDACPDVVGTASRQGCDVVLDTFLALRIYDEANSGACRSASGTDATSCVVRVGQAKVKVFDRDRLNGLRITTRTGRRVVLSKNPGNWLYDDIFESPEAVVAQAARLGCTTGDNGRCLAGLRAKGQHLFVIRWTAPEANVVYTGQPYGLKAFTDSDGDGVTDLVSRSRWISKTIKPDGSIQYRGNGNASPQNK